MGGSPEREKEITGGPELESRAHNNATWRERERERERKTNDCDVLKINVKCRPKKYIKNVLSQKKKSLNFSTRSTHNYITATINVYLQNVRWDVLWTPLAS